MDSVGTNPLPMKGSRVKIIGVLLAVSTLLATRPRATDSQVSAMVSSNSTPVTASHSTKPAVGENPMSRATPSTTTSPNTVWMTVPTTCPVSTDALLILMVRNRAMMPSVMSIATAMAVPRTALVMVISRMAGVT
jgi:hypothetical protein